MTPSARNARATGHAGSDHQGSGIAHATTTSPAARRPRDAPKTHAASTNTATNSPTGSKGTRQWIRQSRWGQERGASARERMRSAVTPSRVVRRDPAKRRNVLVGRGTHGSVGHSDAFGHDERCDRDFAITTGVSDAATVSRVFAMDCAGSGLEQPVLDAKARHPREVTHVPGDEREIVRQRNRSDSEVRLVEPLPNLLEGRSKRPVDLRRRLIEWKHDLRAMNDVADALDKYRVAFARGAVEQLAEIDRGGSLRLGGQECEAPDEMERWRLP